VQLHRDCDLIRSVATVRNVLFSRIVRYGIKEGLKEPIHRASMLIALALVEKERPRTMNFASLYLSRREIIFPASVIYF